MPVPFSIKLQKPPGLTVRAWRSISKAGFVAAGAHWHKHFRPLHFDENARRRYGYQERTKSHWRRKRKAAALGTDGTQRVAPDAGRKYLVFSGTLRKLTELATFRAYPSRFTVVMRGTPYTKKSRKGNRPNIAAEVVKTTARENRVLQGVVAKTIRPLISEYRRTGQAPAVPAVGVFG